MCDHFLPSEIVQEILHRLPVKSIVKCTSVCKAWNSLITSQTFISHHLKRTIQDSKVNGSLFLQFYNEKNKGKRHLHKEDFYSLYSNNQQTDHFFVESFPLSHLFREDRYIVFAGTCNGLVCSADYSPLASATILIWNPLLRKYMVLPKPITTCKKRNRQNYAKYNLCFGFGFDSRNNDYKVVRLMNDISTEDTPYVEVYSLVSHSWRSITATVPQFYLSGHGWLPPVFMNDAIHWVVCRSRCDGSSYNFILSFDVIEETFRELTLPQQSSKYSILSTLLVVEGGHSLVVMNKTYEKYDRWVCNIWMMKEYGITESWTKIFQCDSESYGGISAILALTHTGKVVMHLIGGAIVLVDPIKESVGPLGAYTEAFAGSYIESLFFINKEPNVLSF